MLNGPMTIVAQTVPCGTSHINAEINSTQVGDGAAIATTICVCIPDTAHRRREPAVAPDGLEGASGSGSLRGGWYGLFTVREFATLLGRPPTGRLDETRVRLRPRRRP